MTDSVAQHAGLPHAVFLHRLAGESPSSALEPRLGRAAFVALRLVDLLGPEYTTLHPDAFHYQHVATARCCRDLPPGATETSHLVGLVHGTHDAFEQHRVGLVLPALFAYAHYLEDEMRLEEALDVLDTLLRVGGAQGLAHHAIAVVRNTVGHPSEAIPHAWRAFELYDDELSRMRALGDLGTMLLTVGEVESAERALGEIVRRGATHDVLDNATIELMHCASYRRDRVGFERWREQCDARRESMPPNMLVDYMLKAGIGRARFGQLDRAERLLASALRIADEAGLHEFTFRIERIQAGLRDCDCAEPAAESALGSEAVKEVSASLAELGA